MKNIHEIENDYNLNSKNIAEKLKMAGFYNISGHVEDLQESAIEDFEEQVGDLEDQVQHVEDARDKLEDVVEELKNDIKELEKENRSKILDIK